VGWKAQCILVNEREPGHLGQPLEFDPGRALLLATRLELKLGPQLGTSTLLDCIYPPANECALGAYDGAAVLADAERILGCSADPERPLLARLRATYPGAAMLVLELNSVVNAFGYAYYERGELLRAHVGDMNGVFHEVGALLPEEQPFFVQSEMRGGERIFHQEIGGRTEEFGIAAMGESLAFAVAGRFFGAPLDQAPLETLTVERFGRKASPRPWWRIWG
jgi:hypothetical protein